MRGKSAPIRFLLLVTGGWICARAAMLSPAWEPVVPPRPEEGPLAAAPAPRVALAAGTAILEAPEPAERRRWRPSPPRPEAKGRDALPAATAPPGWGPPPLLPPIPLEVRAEAPPPLLLLPSGPPRTKAGRWALSGGAFARGGGTPALAPGGTLGGSQIGGRLLYRPGGPGGRLALSGRLAMPAGRPGAAEAALGLDWKPLRRVPISILAERRQALGGKGRSAFALTAYGGVADLALPGGLRLDAYAQAGMVGARSRDAFADGSARLSLPAGRLKLGLGVWGAAQPGAARLDLGPQAALRLPVSGRNASLSADWRLRAAGRAAPGSGPALTLAVDF